MDDARIGRFLDRLTSLEGKSPLSDAKLVQLRNTERSIVIEEDGEVVAVGVVAEHPQQGGRSHWSVETALDGGLRFEEFEDRLLVATLELVPKGALPSVWSHRHSLDAVLATNGFVVVRELAYLAVELPIEESDDGSGLRPFTPSDTAKILRVNRAAFSSHREAASMDETEFGRLLDQHGMGPHGFLVKEQGNDLLGFCWTRVHANGDGEIFRVAVSPQMQGMGLGRTLVIGGFDYLAKQPGVSRGTLWVDLSNTPAVNLYRNLGMTDALVNREFERGVG
jgi:mycothiol synthase